MKVTYANGDVIECTVGEWIQLNAGEKSVKAEYQPWMDCFTEGEPIYSAFLWVHTKEGHDWWSDNENKPDGLSRFEEMKREHKAWKGANQ